MMKKIFKAICKVIFIACVAVIILTVFASTWCWRVGMAQINEGHYVSETFTNYTNDIRGTLRLEAYNDEDNNLTGIKYDLTTKGEVIFAVNIANNWTNIIIGDKVYNLNNRAH